MGFADYAVAASMRETLERLIIKVIDRERPRVAYATVDTIDRVARRATVTFVGDPDPVPVSMGSVQPMTVGQVVRIAGPPGDRYIDDVMGLAYVATLEWTPFTPTLTADTVLPNLGSTGKAEGSYMRFGDLIVGWGMFHFNGSGVAAGTGFYRLGIPATAVASTIGIVNLGSGYIYDHSTGLTHTLDIQANPGLLWGRGIFDGGGGINIVDAAAPWVWALGDQIHYSFAYRTVPL